LKFSIFTGDLTISSRKFASVTLLTSGTLAWFFLLQVYLGDVLAGAIQDTYLVDVCMGLFFAFGIISAIIASLIAEKLDRKKIFIIWPIIGVLSTLSLAIIQGLFLSIISCILLGLSLGFVLPSSMAFIADSTTVEERGRVSGITILETFVIAFLAIAIITIFGEGVLTIIIVVSLIRLVSLFAFIMNKGEYKLRKEKIILQIEVHQHAIKNLGDFLDILKQNDFYVKYAAFEYKVPYNHLIYSLLKKSGYPYPLQYKNTTIARLGELMERIPACPNVFLTKQN